MQRTIFFVAMLAIFTTSCGLNIASDSATSTAFIITATWSPTTALSPTQTAEPSGTASTPTLMEGKTSTIVNVRSGPSTSGAALGMINPAAKVQIIGKDPSGSWYQIIFPQGQDGKGWITAQYVNVKNMDAIQMIGAAPTSTSGTAGGQALGTGTPTSIPATITPTLAAALQDNDSQQAPAVNVAFSSTGIQSIIYSSDVSAPTGDAEDWIGFTPAATIVSFGLICEDNSALNVELWQNNTPVPNWPGLACGDNKIFDVITGQNYLLHLSARSVSGGLEYIRYTLSIRTIH